MTAETAEIRDRAAAHRARIIEAALAPAMSVAESIQASMMELAQVWREEAEYFTTAKRRGWKSTADQFTQAAARLAGFAQSLTAAAPPPPAVVSIPIPPLDSKGGGCGDPNCDFQVQCGKCFDDSERQYNEWFARAGYERGAYRLVIDKMREQAHADAFAEHLVRTAQLVIVDDPHPDAAQVLGELATALDVPLEAVAITHCSHPDAQRSTLKSGVIMCTLCQTAVGQVEQLAELVPGSKRGPVITGDATLDYLSGAVDTYEPVRQAAKEAAETIAAGLGAPLASLIQIAPSLPGDPGYREAEHGRPQAPCFECLTADEDPAPWCDCTPQDGQPCKGPCRLLAHAWTFHPGGCSHRNAFKRSQVATDSASPINCMYCGLDLALNPDGLPFGYAPHRIRVPDEMVADHNSPVGTQVTVGGIDFVKIGESPFGDGSEAANVISQLIPTPAVDNPFTSPAAPGSNRAPVRRLTWGELGPLTAATYPVPRPHLSHSYVESLSRCGLSALLSDASKGGHVGPRRPSWSLIGGNAFHAAVETIERAALGIGGADPAAHHDNPYWTEFWEAALTYQVDDLTATLAGTPYANPATWHTANKGMEGYDWWRVQGLDMLTRYLAHHDTAWRSQHTLLQVPADPSAEARTPGQVPRVPVLELPYDITAGSTALVTQGFIDAAWLSTSPEYPTAALEVVDYKTGKSLPSDHFQLTEYADVLRKHLPANFALPVVGRFWRARLGTYTPPIPLLAKPGQDEIDYRYAAANRAMKNAAFAPHVDNMCSSCGSVDLCPAQAIRDATGTMP